MKPTSQLHVSVISPIKLQSTRQAPCWQSSAVTKYRSDRSLQILDVSNHPSDESIRCRSAHSSIQSSAVDLSRTSSPTLRSHLLSRLDSNRLVWPCR